MTRDDVVNQTIRPLANPGRFRKLISDMSKTDLEFKRPEFDSWGLPIPAALPTQCE